MLTATAAIVKTATTTKSNESQTKLNFLCVNMVFGYSTKTTTKHDNDNDNNNKKNYNTHSSTIKTISNKMQISVYHKGNR